MNTITPIKQEKKKELEIPKNKCGIRHCFCDGSCKPALQAFLKAKEPFISNIVNRKHG